MLKIYEILNNDPAVSAYLFDGNRLRAWGFGYAPEQEVRPGPTVRPYVVWQTPMEAPENMLTCPPPLSEVIYQFDVYAEVGDDLDKINTALQYALRLHGNTQSIRRCVFDPPSKLYRAGFDFLHIELKR